MIRISNIFLPAFTSFLLGSILVTLGCGEHNLQSSEVIPSDWRRIELSRFSFFAPADMRGGQAQGIDSELWEYTSRNINLKIELGLYSNDLQSYNDRTGFREELVYIDGEKAKVCAFNFGDSSSNTNDKNKKYILAAHFPNLGKGSEKLTLWASCLSQDDQEIAKLIFRSVAFKQPHN